MVSFWDCRVPIAIRIRWDDLLPMYLLPKQVNLEKLLTELIKVYKRNAEMFLEGDYAPW